MELPPEFEQVVAPAEEEDELLTAKDLAVLSLFKSDAQKKTLSLLNKLPALTLLRKCPPQRVLCEQGAAGASAFLILTTSDVLKLREEQVQSIREVQAARASGKPLPDDLHQQFVALDNPALQKREQTYLVEIERLRPQAEMLERPENKDNLELRQRASAHLLVNLNGQSQTRTMWQKVARLLTGTGRKRRKLPKWIPIDGADVSAETKMASLHEGDLFGEMSCINRVRRSATVVADQDCYLLEMMRNVLDLLQKDPDFKKRMDAVYKKRVLEGHIRRLSIFEDLTDQEFELLRDNIELLEVPTGGLIFEQFDPSDSFYVIRSGLVKVVANAWTQARAAEFSPAQWVALGQEITTPDARAPQIQSKVIAALSPATKAAASQLAAANQPVDENTQALLSGLNEFILGTEWHTKLGKTTADIAAAVDSKAVSLTIADYHDDPKQWSDVESRMFLRLLLEHVFPNGMPRRNATAGPRRTLSYLGRGDYFGEMGVMAGEARMATIYAYDHPDGGANMRVPDSRTGAVPSRVELVRISKEAFQKLCAESPKVKAHVEQMIAKRRVMTAQQIKSDAADLIASHAQSPEFEQLGLIQGQQLMLIDLDRCTRCNQCVEACVAAHDDGHTRLYLDGPRFENFLVPISCRSCLDPVCMIGCPVGSINRGDKGEIVIENWCIGCGMCAEQCPYGSIVMNPLSKPADLSADARKALGAEAKMSTITEQAVVCDLCSSLPSQDPSCVYACPHDAAMRVNAQDYFMSGKR